MKKGLKMKNDVVNVDHITKNKKCLLCCICCSEFLSNNCLHKHIQKGCTKVKSVKTTSVSMKVTSVLMQTTLMIVISQKSIYVRLTVMKITHNDYEFQEWCYITAEVQLTYDGEISPVCLNTECTMILVNQQFLKDKKSDITIQQMLSLITVQELGSNTHESSEFTVIDLYLPDKNRKIAVIFCEVHLVKNLKAHMLIKIDILTPEEISLDLLRKKMIIESCDNTEISLMITTQSINQMN